VFSDGTNNRDSPFQRLQARPDKDFKDSDASLNQPHTMIAEGDDLSSRWALMQDFADEVNSIGYEYRPISQNSNSFAGGALQRAGFFGPGSEFPERFDSQLVFDPVGGQTTSLYVPGFEKPLANPINGATPMPFPLGAPAAPDRQDSFGDRFGNWGSSPAGVAPLPAPDRPDSFDKRFGNWGTSPAAGSGNPGSPVLRALEKYRRSEVPVGPASTSAQGAPPATPALQPDMAGKGVVRILGKFVGNNLIPPAVAASPSRPPLSGPTAPNPPGQESAFGDQSENAPGAPRPDPYPRLQSRRVSSAFPDISPRNLDQPMPPPERAPALGIFSGKPMSEGLLPPPVWGLPDHSNASGDGDWFNFLAGIASRNSAQPPLDEGTQGISSSKRVPRLTRVNGNNSAPAFDSGASAAPLAPSVDPNFSGGLLGRLAALAGIDPNQPAPPLPDDDLKQADIRALDARFSSSGNIKDAVALYNARKSNRR
jgi:hypothetical protein